MKIEIPEDCIIPLRECFGYDGRPPLPEELDALARAEYLALSPRGKRALQQVRSEEENCFEPVDFHPSEGRKS